MNETAVPPKPALRVPGTIVATQVATAAAGAMMLVGLVVELAAGAPASRIFWPVELTTMILFFASMTRHGRQWARVTLTALVATTLLFRLPGLLAGGVPGRPGAAVGFDVAGLAVLVVGVVLMFLPASNAYLRAVRDSARLVSPRVRRALLAVHVVSAVGWMGVITVMATMAIAAAGSAEPVYVRSAYTMMLLVDETFLGPAHQIALLTGVALAAGTPWGLWRRRWVAAKFVLILAIMLVGSAVLQDLAIRANELAQAGASVAEIRAGGGLALALLTPLGPLTGLAATLLAIYKPGGPTRYGRRRARTGSGQGRPVEAPAPQVPLVLRETRPVARDIVSLTLAAPDATPLPAWTPGAHIDVVLPSGLVRQYSLHGDPADRTRYRIAVLREPDGRGGSVQAHLLPVGQPVAVRGPRNTFPLRPAPAYLFIAGGIGITPILPMIRQVARERAEWRLLYLGRSAARMAFLDELRELGDADQVRIVATDRQGRPDLSTVLRTVPDGGAVYGCGPAGLLAEVERLLPAVAPTGRLHLERFTARPFDRAGDRPFDVELRRSGTRLRVPADRSLLDTIREAVPEAPSSCETGLCGSCAVRVVDGTPEHRDELPDLRETGDGVVLFPCVSRARTARLVLDL